MSGSLEERLRRYGSVLDRASEGPVAECAPLALPRVRWRVAAVAAAAALVLLAGGLALGRPGIRGNDASSDAWFDVDPSVGQWLDLSIAPPGLHRRFNEDLARIGVVCLSLEERDGAPTCTEIEGPAGLELVDYVSDGGAETVGVGTTFTTVDMASYLDGWAEAGGVPAGRVAVTVRGHHGFRTAFNGDAVLVWEERPGTIAWLRASVSTYADQLPALAEAAVLRAWVPVAMAARAVDVGIPWRAWDNGHPYVVVARRGGRDCVAVHGISLEGVAGCAMSDGWALASNILESTRVGTTFGIGGLAPPTVALVRVETLTGSLGPLQTSGVPGLTHLAWGAALDPSALPVEGPVTLVGLDSAGREVARRTLIAHRP